MNKPSKLALALGLALSAQSILHAQDHAHLNVGALGTNQNDQLYFVNGAAFIDSSEYVKTLTYTNAGTYAGYFQQNITLTALPRTSANAGPDPAAAAFGSFIQAGMTCLEDGVASIERSRPCPNAATVALVQFSPRKHCSRSASMART